MQGVLKWLVFSMACIVPLLWAACAATRAGYKTPTYTLRQKVNGPVDYEVRDYPGLLLIETPAKPDHNGRDGSFGRLFKFITGNNAAAEKIPMTTPVFFRGLEGDARMSFVMPAEMTARTVPAPSDQLLRLSERPKGLYAVMKIGKKRTKSYLDAEIAKLYSALAESHWIPTGPAEFAYYDPPWIPAWFCRNECMLPVSQR
jgi:hypothetical protein